MKTIVLQFLFFFLPWTIRRRLLCRFFKFELHADAYIGYSLFFKTHVIMAPHSKIGHLNIFKGLSLVHLYEYASISRLNWISGFPLSEKSHFQHILNRSPELIIREHASVTNRHLIDCTDQVYIGKYTTFAGYRSQILTHSIDLYESRQNCKPIHIGDYCFVGTSSVLLGGSSLPNYSVLGACSLLNEKHIDEYTLYGGVPAKPLLSLNKEIKYFNRQKGFVY